MKMNEGVSRHEASPYDEIAAAGGHPARCVEHP
jgi:hypothetical protein